MTLLDASLIPHGRSVFDPDIQAASLDHALWFHRPFRVDDWLLYAQDSPGRRRAPAASPAARSSTAPATLVASVAQEGLIRPRSGIRTRCRRVRCVPATFGCSASY